MQDGKNDILNKLIFFGIFKNKLQINTENIYHKGINLRGGLKIKIFRYIKFKIKNYVFKIKFNKSVKKGKLLLVDWGDRGVGKTTILVNLAKKLNLPIIVSNNNQARLFNIDYFNGDINCYSCSNIDSLRGKDFPNGVLIEEGIDLKTIREILFMHKIKGGYFYSDLIMKQ